jgi:predicted AAA+ superfamily ATPase
MAISNRDRVGRGLDILREGLAPFIRRELQARYGRGWYIEGVEPYLTGATGIDVVQHVGPDDEKFALLDIQALFVVMWNNWQKVFITKLGHVERSFVSELREIRNQWAHQKAFTASNAHRALDTMHRLLLAVSAKEASQLEGMVRELMLQQMEDEHKKAKSLQQETKIAAFSHLKPWREVATPHDDVAQGKFQEAEFAADLAQVIQKEASIEYQDSMEFFRRTYLTNGLSELLKLAVKRLTGVGGAPVVQLQTSFGGGKTHTMLALYHLFSGEVHLDELPELKAIISEVDDELPEANRAVIVGTQFSPFDERVYPDGVKTRTLWGEIAYQLGGKEGYEMFQAEDETGISPGSDKIKALLERFGPALILIDEWVAFARNIHNVDGLPCGSFDANLTFVQALTEGAKRVSDALVVASIHESEIEVGGDGGKIALERLKHTFGRLETIWKPATRVESMKIVCRRLFAQIDEVARDSIVKDFRAMYRQYGNDFPKETQERDYEYRMRIAYPIHPELFDRLYEDWSTLERFQRTRGILRLMAIIIHRLWQMNDRSILIMPGTLPLDSPRTLTELTKYLPDGWDAVVDSDVDGEQSRAFILDNENPQFGRCSASRRVARTIFMGSAPKNASRGQGVDEKRVKLGCAQPGEHAVVFGDALRRLQEELTYLYTDKGRYWFDTHPSVNRLAAERAEQYQQDLDEVEHEIHKRLRRIKTIGEFAAVHMVPSRSSDVPDDQAVRLVVLPLRAIHRRGNLESRALQLAREILLHRGSQPRLHRNMLVFVAMDANKFDQLIQAVCYYIAWKTIEEEKEILNLDEHQRAQAKNKKSHFHEVINLRLLESYEWLLVPKQSGTSEVEWENYRLNTVSGSDFIERASRKLVSEGKLIIKWAPALLKRELDQYMWKEQLHLPTKQIWNYLTQYLYLPRIRDEQVLRKTIEDGVVARFFGYAQSVDVKGKYEGFDFGALGVPIHLNSSSLLIKPDIAEVVMAQLDEHKKQRNVQEKSKGSGGIDGGSRSGNKGNNGSVPPQPSKPEFKKLIATVDLDPIRYLGELNTIRDEILEHLQNLNEVDMQIHLDITVKVPDGIPEEVIRTVRENARTLKVDVQFEEE